MLDIKGARMASQSDVEPKQYAAMMRGVTGRFVAFALAAADDDDDASLVTDDTKKAPA